MSLKVVSVSADIESHSIVSADFAFPERMRLTRQFIECSSMRKGWTKYSCRKVGEDPLGDFAGFSFLSGMSVVFSEVVAKLELRNHIESVGELLPVSVEGREAYAINVLRTIDACDPKKSQLYPLSDGSLVTNWPVFKKLALRGVAGLFRIRECASNLYSAEPDDNTGFCALCAKYGFSGLRLVAQPLT